MTDRGKLLLVTAVALYVLSRAFGVPALTMASLACLTLVAGAVLYTRIASGDLAARRQLHPQRLFHDAEGVVELVVRNDGRLPTALLLLEDHVPPVLSDRPRFVLDPLPAGQAATVRYTVRGLARGLYAIGPAVLQLRDPFGIASRAVRFGQTDELVVYPPVWALPPTLPRLGRQGTSSEGQLRPLATSGEFSNVREYVRGDDLRKVHWKSTARRAKLMVKQEEGPQDSQATLVLDRRRHAHRGSGPTSTFELAVSATASAAYHLMSRNYALRLLMEPFATPPRSVPWEAVLEQLAMVQPGGGTTLSPLWQQLAKGRAGEGLLLAVVPVPSAEELRDIVRAGRAFSGRVAVLTSPAMRPGDDSDMTRAIAALRGAGWRVTTYRPGDTLAHRWRELALQERPRAVAGVGAR